MGRKKLGSSYLPVPTDTECCSARKGGRLHADACYAVRRQVNGERPNPEYVPWHDTVGVAPDACYASLKGVPFFS